MFLAVIKKGLVKRYFYRFCPDTLFRVMIFGQNLHVVPSIAPGRIYGKQRLDKSTLTEPQGKLEI